jgi:hypothetical protein
MKSEAEEWRPAVGLEGRYDVSNLGRVRGWRGRQGILLKTPRVLRPRVTASSGYLAINVSVGGAVTARTVHSMVCEAFLGSRPDPGWVTNHRDGNKLNNRADNLEWCSRSENNRHALAEGLMPKGSASPLAKLTEAMVEEARRLFVARKATVKQLAETYGVAFGTMRSALRGTHWSHVPGAVAIDNTKCRRGHTRTPETTMMVNGHRSCRVCRREIATRLRRAHGVPARSAPRPSRPAPQTSSRRRP